MKLLIKVFIAILIGSTIGSLLVFNSGRKFDNVSKAEATVMITNQKKNIWR